MTHRATALAAWSAVLLGMAVGGVLVGCGPDRYRILSFFFDGVPDPNAPSGFEGRQVARAPSGRIVYGHQPFVDDQCDACHQNTDDIFARAQVRKDVCLDCHGSVMTQHAVVHGPVLHNVCTLCHAPHQALHEHLLRAAAPDICTQCHVASSLGSMPPPHLEPDSDCLSCHSGHGGPDRQFLKTGSGAPLATAAGVEPQAPPAAMEEQP